MLGARKLLWINAAIATVAACAVLCAALPGTPQTLEELKARINSVSPGDRPQLCVQVAQRQLEAADKLYAAVETEKAQATLADVIAFSEQARDYSIQSHKHEKQIEIEVRRMTRKLTDIKRTLTREEQPALDNAIAHLQRVRDDLLLAMFPKVPNAR
jgi:hypothetical protein